MKTNPHVLLIDDDHIFCMIAEEMLAKAGFSVTTTSNGHKGIQLLNKKSRGGALKLATSPPNIYVNPPTSCVFTLIHINRFFSFKSNHF